ncbi:MAG: hypothetical protein J1E34_02455 [Oscillospiraceae bacterium]|nr:hypothetical protein [Oscillospiraceae bacterium]
MYEKIKGSGALKRDRTVLITLLIAAVFFAAVLTPVFIGTSGSYRFHCFVRDFAEDLVSARSGGAIMLSADGEKTKVSADSVSKMFMTLADFGFGQQIKEIPNAENISLSLPNAAELTLYSTPGDYGEDHPTGVTVRYKNSEGEVFMYLHRYMEFENLTWLLYL